MYRIYFIMFSFLMNVSLQAQNIYSAVHLNNKYDVRTEKQIKKIEISSTFYNLNNVEKQKEVIFLNDQFRILKTERYNSEGELIYKSEKEYQSDSLIIKSRTSRKISLIGFDVTKTLYIYDSNNYLIKIEKRNGKNQLIEVISFENNGNGDPILLIINDGEFGYEKATYDYSNNTYSTVVYNSNNEMISSESFLKLNFDLPIKGETINEYGDVTESKDYMYEYKYDKFGNWIKEVRYKNDGKNKVKNAEFTRRITYQ